MEYVQLMKQFLFLTHKTPKAVRSVLRKELFAQYLKALHAQTYDNWKVLIIEEAESNENKIKTVDLKTADGTTVKDKLTALYNRKDVCDYLEASDYIVKLDDDDIISPTILKTVASMTFDVYHDDWHTFYDISSGQMTQLRRPWIPSTCIHATRHALAPLEANGPKNYYVNSVLYTDHSKFWHKYYKDKQVVKASKEHPVYLRVLSPTSITAGAKKNPIDILSDIDLEHYYRYLKGFGNWQSNATSDFASYTRELGQVWANFSGKEQVSIPEFPETNKLLGRLKRLWKSN